MPKLGDLVLDDLGNFSGADVHFQPFIEALWGSALHCLSEIVEFGADRAVDHLAADLDDEAAQDGGIDVQIDGDVAADAGAEILLDRVDLAVVERVGGGRPRR